MTETPVLEIRQLRTYFNTAEGTAKAVDGVSLSIQAGETFALVGESGCGKSMTALSVLQLIPAPAGHIAGGHIFLSGTDVTTLPPRDMRKIRGNKVSMIFQEPMTALNPVFTIGNQILESILLHQKLSRANARAKAVEMLDRVGISDPAKRFEEYPHQMSGGMRQRVMIAMALACRPELLIADEPTTALDVTIQAQILGLIQELREEFRTAVLLITHDMGVVREHADHVGVMYAGKIVEYGPREEIFRNPSHPYTQLLLRSIPSRTRRENALATIHGIVPQPTEFPPGCRFHTRCPFVMDRCRKEAPEDFQVAPEHQAACFLLNKRAARHSSDSTQQLEPAPPSAVDPSSKRLTVSNLKMYFPIRKGLLKRLAGHVMAVDGIDLEIHRGETVALVGESGCGKTTAGKCIVRLHTPTSGLIEFQGQDLAGLKGQPLKTLRRNVQMIFQDPFSSLNPRMMIRDTVIEGMNAHKIGRPADRLARAESLMSRVGLDPDMLGRYPHEFSGGQRHRLGLARALAVEPELIICDEATSSLDVSVQAQILNLLKLLQSETSLSYLFITHDLGVVEYLADRVAVMYLGRIVETGSSEEIFQGAKHPYTRALLSAVPQVDASTGRKRIVLHGDVPSPINPPRGCHFHPRCPDAMPECSQAYPETTDFGDTHSCKCHLFKPSPGG